MLVGQEIAEANGETGAYLAVLAFMMWVVVTPLSHSVTGLTAYSDASGATGLFTGLIVGILGMEIYCAFRKMDALKIKMPDQVPPGVARAFEVLIPTALILVIMSTIGWLCTILLGKPMNDLIVTYVQEPLKAIIGVNIFAVMILYVIIMLFWCVGIHGNNMVSAVTLTLVVAIFIFGKREDNRAIDTLSIVPEMFNINETVTFGIPLVLNPILDIPFILAPVVTVLVGYILIAYEKQQNKDSEAIEEDLFKNKKA